jgi:hypothetical protein
MATRMQQRRGTAAQWISTNSGNGPILNAGEIGYETDTNKFKIGDGVNHWINLDYFIDANSTVNPAFGSSIVFEGATANAFETTVAVTDPTADRTITLPDASGTVVLADGSGNVTVSGDLTVSGTTTTINSTTINATTGIVFEGATANEFETTLAVTDPTQDRTLTLPDSTGTVATEEYVDGAISGAAFDPSLAAGTGIEFNAETDQYDIDSTVTTNDGTQTLTNKTLTSPTVSGLTLSDSSIVIEGSSADAHETTLTVTNPTADRTITLPDETGTVQLRVTDVSDTEIGYLNGVTSAIQTQLNDKAPIASPTFTGTVTLAADPASALQAATKQYVDNTASGIVAKPQVLGATTANIDATYNNGTAGVGATLTHNTNGVFPAEAGGASGWAVGKGILVKNQTNKEENGRYYVSDMGSVSTPYVLTRCSYCDEASEIPGAYIFVQDGTLAGTGWIQVVADPATFTVGTDDIDVYQFSGSGTITAGTGLTLTGNSFSVDHPVASQSGNSGKYLTTDGTNTSWGTVSGYSAPTLGSTSIASGATVTTIAGLTLTSPTLNDPKINLTIDPETASYTAVLANNGQIVTMSVGSANTFSIPTNASVAFPIGTQINVLQIGAGQTTIQAVTSGTTSILSTGAAPAAPQIRARYGSATCIKAGTDLWYVIGDIA